MIDTPMGRPAARARIGLVLGSLLAVFALATPIGCGDDVKQNPPDASGGKGGGGGKGGTGGQTAKGGAGGDNLGGASGDAATEAGADVSDDVAVEDGGPEDAPMDSAGGDVSSGGNCGGSGQPCCRGKVCNGGGCCIVPNSGSGGFCVGATESCKKGNDGFAGTCNNGSCGTPAAPCGALTQMCCDPGGGVQAKCTANGTTCDNGKCAGCGRPGEPGCNGGPPGDDSYRCAVGAVLRNGMCVAAGDAGM